MNHFNLIVIGGGASGFFTAINVAQQNPNISVLILEHGNNVLTKVKVSGGGRCNVTHAQFIPQGLVTNYPRGKKELLGPFNNFATSHVMTWFETRGVALKIEDDGRVFPQSNNSQTIIDCFLNQAKKHNVTVLKKQTVKQIIKDAKWIIKTNRATFYADKIVVATGSNTKIWGLLKTLNHTIITPVPSLFTFTIKDPRISTIPGVVVKHVSVKVLNTTLQSFGPLLITHWGLSAPAILKLSAFGAIELAKLNYTFNIEINFINMPFSNCLTILKHKKTILSKKTISNSNVFKLPKRLWQQLVFAAKINETLQWANCNKTQLEALSSQLTQAVFKVTGKSTFKEEFVTAGGVDLKEVSFKTFESKLHKALYFTGEVLNIDAVTGGFNFQNAWTSAYLAAQHISRNS